MKKLRHREVKLSCHSKRMAELGSKPRLLTTKRYHLSCYEPVELYSKGNGTPHKGFKQGQRWERSRAHSVSIWRMDRRRAEWRQV